MDINAPQHLTLQYVTISDQGLQNIIGELKSQEHDLPTNSPEYEYDKLFLASYKQERDIREENPNLDPMTQEGAAAIYQLMDQDPKVLEIDKEIRAVSEANPFECSSWGIPF